MAETDRNPTACQAVGPVPGRLARYPTAMDHLRSFQRRPGAMAATARPGTCARPHASRCPSQHVTPVPAGGIGYRERSERPSSDRAVFRTSPIRSSTPSALRFAGRHPTRRARFRNEHPLVLCPAPERAATPSAPALPGQPVGSSVPTLDKLPDRQDGIRPRMTSIHPKPAIGPRRADTHHTAVRNRTRCRPPAVLSDRQVSPDGLE